MSLLDTKKVNLASGIDAMMTAVDLVEEFAFDSKNVVTGQVDNIFFGTKTGLFFQNKIIQKVNEIWNDYVEIYLTKWSEKIDAQEQRWNKPVRSLLKIGLFVFTSPAWALKLIIKIALIVIGALTLVVASLEALVFGLENKDTVDNRKNDWSPFFDSDSE